MPLKLSDKELTFIDKVIINVPIEIAKREVNISDYEIATMAVKIKTELDYRRKVNMDIEKQQDWIKKNPQLVLNVEPTKRKKRTDKTWTIK